MSVLSVLIVLGLDWGRQEYSEHVGLDSEPRGAEHMALMVGVSRQP